MKALLQLTEQILDNYNSLTERIISCISLQGETREIISSGISLSVNHTHQLYAAPAGWGFVNAGERNRLDELATMYITMSSPPKLLPFRNAKQANEIITPFM